MGSPPCCCCGRSVKTVDRNQTGKSDAGDLPPGRLVNVWPAIKLGLSWKGTGQQNARSIAACRRGQGIPLGAASPSLETAILVFSFLLQHNKANVGCLKLSLKPKSFSGLVSKGGLSKTDALITATSCD